MSNFKGGGGHKKEGGQVWQRLARGKSRAVTVEIRGNQSPNPQSQPPQDPPQGSPSQHQSPQSSPQHPQSPQSSPQHKSPQREQHQQNQQNRHQHQDRSSQNRPSQNSPPQNRDPQSRDPQARDKGQPTRPQNAPPSSGATKPLRDFKPKQAQKPQKPQKQQPHQERRIKNKLTISEALSEDENQGRSLAALRRARLREREKEKHQPTSPQRQQSRVITLPESITVADLANRMAQRSAEVIKVLMKLGVTATVNETIDADTAELVVAEFGNTVERVSEGDVETELLTPKQEDPANLKPRCAVVSIMGHVDHGKTTILDALRNTSVAAKEAGGITQHIGAYQVTVNNKPITFIDTPGHQAFTKMRARGAGVTDIVALVVAADDGVKEQTIESIKHSKLAKTPLVVIVNKMDAPGADPNRIYTQLTEHSVITEPQGGDILVVEVSAKEGTNLAKIPETILLQAELLELKANPDATASGVVLESGMDVGRGPMATVIMKRGKLKKGDIFVSGATWGKVRAMLDWQSKPMSQAMPGEPARIQGFTSPPNAGEDFAVVKNEATAREISDYRRRRGNTSEPNRLTLEEQLKQAETTELNVVLKADTHGSTEALAATLEALSSDEMAVKVAYKGVGDVNESDADLASVLNGYVVAFSVRINKQAAEVIKRHNTPTNTATIIYEAENALKEHIEKVLRGDEIPLEEVGKATVLQVFDIGKVGKIAGCKVSEGKVRATCIAKLKRGDEELCSGKLASLKHEKAKVSEVIVGKECGIKIADWDDYQPNDLITLYLPA